MMKDIYTNMSYRRGFTFIELILYVSIVTMMLTALIPYAWNIIGSGAKSSYEQEVYSQARYISERLKYEIRNSLGINSVTANQIVLCETAGSCATNPTTITFTSPNIIIQNKGDSPANLNSNNVQIISFIFTNNSSGNTENVQFLFTIDDNLRSSRQEYQVPPIIIEGDAEVRSN